MRRIPLVRENEIRSDGGREIAFLCRSDGNTDLYIITPFLSLFHLSILPSFFRERLPEFQRDVVFLPPGEWPSDGGREHDPNHASEHIGIGS